MTGLKEEEEKKRVVRTQKKKYCKYICKVIGNKMNICKRF